MRALSFAWLLPLALACMPVMAKEAPPGPPPLALKAVPRMEAAPQQGGRFALSARFAREESAGDLHEGGGFSLIGRFAKTGMSCDFSDIFSNGFEGN